MNFTKKNKRKTAMLLHQLEESLGQYVIQQQPTIENLPNKTVDNILEREDVNKNQLTIEELIASTYIEEVFHFALEVTRDNSINKYIKQLQQMFKDYDIPTIRNVISHPNRPFLDEYWYKIAAISSSKIIDIIGLKGVKEALVSAESNNIIDPPDDWLEIVTKSLILNNLPSKFEHSITELIGRDNEEKELLKSLQNPRISTTAIVAAGGIGKTALVLDILGRLIYDSTATNWCDGIIFIDRHSSHIKP
jgi:ATP-dependent Clp protease ATP-binding subunit ClpA